MRSCTSRCGPPTTRFAPRGASTTAIVVYEERRWRATDGSGRVTRTRPPGERSGPRPGTENYGPDGMVFVAGDGRVARFDRDGKPLGGIELPHLAELLKESKALRKQAEEQI